MLSAQQFIERSAIYVLAAVAAISALCSGYRNALTIERLGRGRYPAFSSDDHLRFVASLRGGAPSSVILAGDGGDDITELLESLRAALIEAGWTVERVARDYSIAEAIDVTVHYEVQDSMQAHLLVAALCEGNVPAALSAEPWDDEVDRTMLVTIRRR